MRHVKSNKYYFQRSPIGFCPVEEAMILGYVDNIVVIISRMFALYYSKGTTAIKKCLENPDSKSGARFRAP